MMGDSYDIYVLTGNTDLGEPRPLEGVEHDKWIITDKYKVCYLSLENQTFGNILKEIKNINPEFIYLNSMFSKVFTIYPLIALVRRKIEAKVIISPRGMLKQSALNFKKSKKKLFLSLFKRTGVAKTIYKYHATDRQEQIDIASILKIADSKVILIQNCPKSIKITKKGLEKSTNLKLVYISRIAKVKNLDFFLKILGKIKPSTTINLNVFGNEEENYWDKCKNTIAQLPQNIKVNYHGSLKHEEVNDVLKQHHFFVLPTFGENFGHAIFEAFAAGRPVLISDQTPWRGLEKKKIGFDIPLANEKKWIETIERMANMEQDEFDIWCENARNFANDFIHNSDLKEKYKKLFS